MMSDLKLVQSYEISLGIVMVQIPSASVSICVCSRKSWRVNFASSALRVVTSAGSSPALQLIQSRKCIRMACRVLHLVA